TTFERLTFPGRECHQRRQSRPLVEVLLSKPDLVSAQECRVELRRVVRRENELRAVWIERWVLECPDDLPHQERVKAAVEFVDDQDMAAFEDIEERSCEGE